jgi:hypothetical protein
MWTVSVHSVAFVRAAEVRSFTDADRQMSAFRRGGLLPYSKSVTAYACSIAVRAGFRPDNLMLNLEVKAQGEMAFN